ncbi:hypothetical protein C7434_4389 [Pantoea sp. PNA 14-12]|nr:hypothetical protein C7434_4389 [Pantoea sp. PNA 14-12]
MPPCSLTQLAWHVGCSPGNGQGRAGNRLWPFIHTDRRRRKPPDTGAGPLCT